MNVHFLKYSLVALTLTALFSFSLLNEWELKKDKNGVKVYTRSRTGSQLKEYKAIVEINTSVEKAFALLADINSYPDWQHNCSEAKVVSRPTKDNIIVYVLTNAPWPASDRDIVIENITSTEEDGSIFMQMNAISEGVDKRDNAVRISYLDGFWKITPKNGGVEVVQQVHADPGGKIPDWLANSAVVDSPYNTMLNMKTKLEEQ